MLETITERREYVIDLRIQFFALRENSLEDLQAKLSFHTVDLIGKPIFFMETISVDFDSDWAGDKPGFITSMSDMVGQTRWITDPEVDERFPDTIDQCLGQGNLQEWYYFSRVVVEVDSKFEWDFDDEDGMSQYDEEIKYPFFRGLRLGFQDLKVASYNLALHDCY